MIRGFDAKRARPVEESIQSFKSQKKKVDRKLARDIASWVEEAMTYPSKGSGSKDYEGEDERGDALLPPEPHFHEDAKDVDKYEYTSKGEDDIHDGLSRSTNRSLSALFPPLPPAPSPPTTTTNRGNPDSRQHKSTKLVRHTRYSVLIAASLPVCVLLLSYLLYAYAYA